MTSLNILLVGDASNCHNSLAAALRRLGYNVVVASDGSRWMHTRRDIDLSRRPGLIGGAWLWARLNAMKRHHFAGYDIVAISNPNFLSLRPGRILDFFRFLKDHNRSVFLTALGTDIPFIEMCCATDSPLRYSEWKIGQERAPMPIADPEARSRWCAPAMRRLQESVYDSIDGAVAVLYEYYLSLLRVLPPEKIAYAGIPIDTTAVTPVNIPDDPGCIKFFIGVQRGRELVKGTDRLLTAARRIVDQHPRKASLDIVENLPYDEYIRRMRSAHVVLDQLYSYTPATNALLAMAMGLVTFSGNEPEFYDFIGEHELRPILGCRPDDAIIFNTLEHIVQEPSMIRTLGHEGRQFVLRHNDSFVVARRFLDFWTSRLHY